MAALPVLVVVPLLKCAAPVFMKLVIGSSSSMALSKIDKEFLRDAENDFSNTLHQILKPAFENVQDHVTKAAKAEFKACFDKLRNGLVYLDNDFVEASAVTSLSADQASPMGSAASSVSVKLSKLSPTEVENACRWFRKAHTAALVLCHNSQLDLSYRLEAMSVVLFCSAFEHVSHPNRAVKMWKSQLSQFLDDAEIRNVLENPTISKNRELLESVREMCNQIYEAASKISMVDFNNEKLLEIEDLGLDGNAVANVEQMSPISAVPTLDIFMLECMGKDHENAYLSIVNTGFELGCFDDSESPLSIKVFDAERIFTSNDGRLIVMVRQYDVQWILYNESCTKIMSLKTIKHFEPIINAVGAILSNGKVIVFILDSTGKLLQQDILASTEFEEVKVPPMGTGNADIAISWSNQLLLAISHDKTLFIAVTSIDNPSKDWKILSDYPDDWLGGNAKIRMDAKYDQETMETSILVYGKGSRFVESSIFFIIIDKANVVKISSTKTVKLGFGSRKQRFACSFGQNSGSVFAITKDLPNMKGNGTTIQKFDLTNLEKSDIKLVVKPLMTTLRDVSVSMTSINLAFHV